MTLLLRPSAIPEDPIASIAYGQKVIFFLIFRPIAVGALLTTVIACVCVIIQALIDHRNNTTGYYDGKPTPVVYPAPSWIGVIKAFSTIMFAFAGASTFPTIQADMKHKHQFKWSAIIACTSKRLFLMIAFSLYRFKIILDWSKLFWTDQNWFGQVQKPLLHLEGAPNFKTNHG